MAKDHLYIGECPNNEEPVQVGTEDYISRARKECRAYINQLRRVYGEEPFGARLFIKSNPHDFGSYLSVECEYIDSLEESVDYAFELEAGIKTWDEEAKKELGLVH